LQLSKGDLVVLDPECRGEAAILSGGWCSGVSERSGERGDFPSEVVCIVPAMTKPPPDIMVRSSSSGWPPGLIITVLGMWFDVEEEKTIGNYSYQST